MTRSKLQKIKGFVKQEINKSKDSQHGWDHLRRTAENAEKIVNSLSVKDKINVSLLMATCYLHDINRAYYSPTLFNYFFETRNSKSVLPKILMRLNISEKEKTIIENAIYSSSFSFPFKKLNKDKDLYTQLLQDADTLDYFSKEREASFNSARKKFGFYTFLSLFSGFALKYGRKNLKNYLNFPQISKESYV